VTDDQSPEEITPEQKAKQIKDRKTILVRARNRALGILAREYPDRFQQIKDDLLVKWGHEPINKAHQRRHPEGDPTTPPPPIV
jgi:hypothetical protein